MVEKTAQPCSAGRASWRLSVADPVAASAIPQLLCNHLPIKHFPVYPTIETGRISRAARYVRLSADKAVCRGTPEIAAGINAGSCAPPSDSTPGATSAETAWTRPCCAGCGARRATDSLNSSRVRGSRLRQSSGADRAHQRFARVAGIGTGMRQRVSGHRSGWSRLGALAGRVSAGVRQNCDGGTWRVRRVAVGMAGVPGGCPRSGSQPAREPCAGRGGA
jgi:hypothetical protein